MHDAGVIFNIQPYSVHDGPGIRDVVFFKGCTLACRWCSNPESQASGPEISHNVNRCLGYADCGLCIKACPSGSITPTAVNLPTVNRVSCLSCGFCSRACPAKALELIGRKITVDELCDTIHQNDSFYVHSDGGVTLGGGEPLMQPAFAAALFLRLGEEGIHRAVATAGHVPWDNLRSVCAHVDLLLYRFLSRWFSQLHRAVDRGSSVRCFGPEAGKF